MGKLGYKKGIKDGFPICVAYLAVSFTFGLAVSELGLSPFFATLISATNLTSAGQFAGISLIATETFFLEIFLAVFIINIRYLLMGVSISQNLPENVGMGKRLILSFFVTDEIFAVANFRGKNINFRYFIGLATLPYFGWVIGTLLGGLVNNLLPERLQLAMGIALYCMFISIILPPAKKSVPLLFCMAVSISLSCLMYFTPVINTLSLGIRVVVASVISACISALIFPIKNKEEISENSADSVNEGGKGNA